MRLKITFALLTLACAFSLNASTVGTCRNDKHPYPTITAAILAAPKGGVIEVCAGTYPEQLVIDKALTIRGIGTFTLAAPPGGIVSLAVPGSGRYADFAQVFINAPGAEVNISYMVTAGGNLAISGGQAAAYYFCQSGDLVYPIGFAAGIHSVDGNVVLNHVQTGFDLGKL